MREAFFALGGAALGIIGTLVADMQRARRDDIRDRRQRLRDVSERAFFEQIPPAAAVD